MSKQKIKMCGEVRLKEQTENDIREFAKGLPLLKMNAIGSIFYEMLPLCGVGQTIAYSRFLSLQRKVAFGVHALLNAYIKEHKSIWGDYLDDSIFERSMYFENSIEAYNKVIDYVYLILYFNFDLYEKIDKKTIKTKEDIMNVSVSIRGNKLKKIDKWISNNEDTKDFSIKFNQYKIFISEMRNLTNDIKHRGCIAVGGTELARNTKVTKVIDGDEIDITNLVSEIRIDLDSEINKLVEVHRQTVELQIALYSLCNFQKQLNEFLDKHI